MPNSRAVLCLALALLIGGCGGTYYRISTRAGKTYYVNKKDIIYDDPKGYVVIKDLNTGKRVRIAANDYMQEEVSKSTVRVHQVDSVLYRGQYRDEQQMLR